jgi:hypothetical protein
MHRHPSEESLDEAARGVSRKERLYARRRRKNLDPRAPYGGRRRAALRTPALARWLSLAFAAACTFVLLVACSAPSVSPVPSIPSLGRSYSQAPAALDPDRTGPTLHVAPDGDDDNGDGTEADPFQTIKKAAAVVEPGMTVIVADGTYEGAFATRASGQEDARITYVSETKWGAKLVGDGNQVGEDTDAVWRNYGDYVDIQGFDISGTMNDGLIQTGSYARLVENRVYGFAEGCISTYERQYALHDIDMIGNVVHDCGSTSLHHGIYPGHPGGTISNNISYGNAGFGIHCWHNCNQLVISNNLVFDNGEGGILVGQGDGPNDGDVEADQMIVANNIAVDNGNLGIRESGASGSANRYLNNNVSGNEYAGIGLLAGQEVGTITERPEFLDFRIDGSGDYRLKSSSADVDGGTSAGAIERDIVGIRRPQGGGVDIGVYEQ